MSSTSETATTENVVAAASVAPQPVRLVDVSFKNIIDSLMLKEFRFGVKDLLYYSVVVLTAFMTLMYLFPQQIVILLTFCVFLIVVIVYIAICKRLTVKTRPIDEHRLNDLRNVYNHSRID